MPLYHYEWLCMTLYDSVWLCMTLYDSVCLSMTLYIKGYSYFMQSTPLPLPRARCVCSSMINSVTKARCQSVSHKHEKSRDIRNFEVSLKRSGSLWISGALRIKVFHICVCNVQLSYWKVKTGCPDQLLHRTALASLHWRSYDCPYYICPLAS